MPTGSFRLRQLGGGSGLSGWPAKLHLTVTGAGVLGFALLGWFLAKLMSSRTMFFLVYACVIGVALAWVVARRRLSFEVVRTALPARMRAGQSIDVTLNLTANRRATMLLFSEQLSPELGLSFQTAVAGIASGETASYTYPVRPRLRGVYSVGPATATWSDPFGISRQEQLLAEPVQVIVHPSTELVHDRVLTRMWEDPPIRPPVSRPWPTGFEFYGLRDYVPGDDLRRVVWNAVAKTGKMLVRESEQGITDRVIIIVDNGEEYHSPGHPSATFERAIVATASIAVKHLHDGMSVTLAANDGILQDAVRGHRAQLPLLDALAKIQLTSATLATATDPLIQHHAGGTHIVVITPHVDNGTATRLRLLLGRGASIVVAQLVWDESDPLSMQRAAALGCRVVQVPLSGPLQAVFGRLVGAGVR